MDVLLRKGTTNNYARTVVINVDYQRKTRDMATQVISGAAVGWTHLGEGQEVLSSYLMTGRMEPCEKEGAQMTPKYVTGHRGRHNPKTKILRAEHT